MTEPSPTPDEGVSPSPDSGLSPAPEPGTPTDYPDRPTPSGSPESAPPPSTSGTAPAGRKGCLGAAVVALAGISGTAYAITQVWRALSG